MLNVRFKNCGVRTILKKCFPFIWNLNSKHFIFMPDWSVINWKQRTWVHFNLFKDDGIFYNNLIAFFFFSIYTLSQHLQRLQTFSILLCLETKRIRNFENKQTKKQIFITIIFNQREKSYFFEFLKLPPNRTRSLAHCIFIFFWDFVLKLPFSKSFLICIFPKSLFTSKLYFEAF